MVLVNLSHVCSHLQNASLARLGLTSIPYTRLHLSLAILLHKQGFISSVKLGGPSPPASTFPNNAARGGDTHGLTSAPLKERAPLSEEAALWERVAGRREPQELRQMGFKEKEVAFAETHALLTKEQLLSAGGGERVAEWLHGHDDAQTTPEDLLAAGAPQIAADILLRYGARPIKDRIYNALADERNAHDARQDYLEQNHLDKQSFDQDQQTVFQREPFKEPARATVRDSIRHQLERQDFDLATLQYVAGDAKYTTPRHLEQDGLTLQAMGQSITGQAVAPLPPHLRDPKNLETEGVVTQANRASRRLWLGLKYYDGMPVLSKARMLSKPTKRIWLDSFELGKIVRGGYAGEVKGMARVGEIVAVSTDRGILEARECVERGVGGMVLCRVW